MSWTLNANGEAGSKEDEVKVVEVLRTALNDAGAQYAFMTDYNGYVVSASELVEPVASESPQVRTQAELEGKTTAKKGK